MAKEINKANNSTMNPKIIRLNTMKEVKQKIDQTLKEHSFSKSLLAFDIDFTMVIPNQPAFYFPYIKKYNEVLKKNIETLSPEQKDILLNLGSMSANWKLVESEIPEVVNYYKNLNHKVIAFTSCLTGKLGNIENIEEWRYNELKRLNLDFSESFSDYQNIIFKDLPPHLSRYPMFYKGILIGNGENGKNTKGDTLISFFKKVNYYPDLIILVDDKKQNLLDVESSLKQYDENIKFVGIEYLAGRNFVEGDLSEEEFLKFWIELSKLAKKLAP